MTVRFLSRLTVIGGIVLLSVAVAREPYERRQSRTPIVFAGGVAEGRTPGPTITAVSAATGVRPAFALRTTDDGGRQIYFGSAELQFAHTAYADRRTIVDVRADGDHVSIEMSRQSGFTVTRGGATVSLYPADATEADFVRMRALLADSLSVRRLRTLVAALDDSKNPGVIALQLADAALGLLDGDPGAPARLGQRFARRTAAGTRRVMFDEGSSCWYTYERNVTQAWEDYTQCASSFSIWNPLSAGCAAEWVIRVEGDWAEYLSCTTLASLGSELEIE